MAVRSECSLETPDGMRENPAVAFFGDYTLRMQCLAALAGLTIAPTTVTV
jgi:hypothetical protein